MKGPNSTNPTPPPVPKVNRETGAVETLRKEDVGYLDGWASSEDPFEGGVSGTRFNDAQPESERTKDSAEFNSASGVPGVPGIRK